jgi:hypothetical protein
MDATDNELVEAQYYGCCVVDLYNGERPHSALGPGLPGEPTRRTALTGHRVSLTHRVVARARLGGLHHDYGLEHVAA